MIEALYIHIPFCVQRCLYCAFPTRACHDEALMDSYVDALSLALRRASKAGLLSQVKTIYIGGGTPSYLGSRRLNSLVYLVSLSVCLENVGEFTVEANPDSLTPAMVRDLYALGVDRFSLGVQSFDDAVLAAYGRAHTAAQALAAIEAVQQRTDNLSIDLICGGPGQGMASWRSSVQQAIALGIPHVSVYPLALEEGTPLARQVQEGRVAAPNDELEADMMLAAEELLGQAGLRRYETASYAKPGREARHNSAYWAGVEYLGLGTGASSMLSPESYEACRRAGLFAAAQAPEAGCVRVRVAAEFDTAAYSCSQGHPVVSLECLDARQALLEDVMLSLRTSAGASGELVARATREAPQLAAEFERLRRAGLLQQRADGGWAPTQRGWLLGNEVFGAVWGLA